MTDSLSPDMQPVLLRRKQVEALIGFGKSTIYRLIEQGKFPSPIYPAGTSISAWVASEVQDWLNEQILNSRRISSK